MALEELEQLAERRARRDAHGLADHHLGERARARREQQVAQREHARELASRPERVDVLRDEAAVALDVLAQVAHELVRRPRHRHRDVLGDHAAARRVGRVLQEVADRLGGLARRRDEDRVGVRVVELCDEVRAVRARERDEDVGRLGRRELADRLGRVHVVHVLEQLGRVRGRERGEHRRALLRVEAREGVHPVGVVERVDVGAERRAVARPRERDELVPRRVRRCAHVRQGPPPPRDTGSPVDARSPSSRRGCSRSRARADGVARKEAGERARGSEAGGRGREAQAGGARR